MTILFVAVIGSVTRLSLRPVPESLAPDVPGARTRILDQAGRPLTVSYQDGWNLHETLPLERMPQLLRDVFVLSEDRRYWTNQGADWRARFAAAWQNLRAGKAVRGASTISEQVVRMLHPRPRKLWSRWLEGFEARALEQRFGKAAILEFYLNQVPYARQRRGVVQAARDYFNRELETLSVHEMLALTVLVRAPSRFDLRRDSVSIASAVRRLAKASTAAGLIDEAQMTALSSEPLQLAEMTDDRSAAYFLADLRKQLPQLFAGSLPATLSSSLDIELNREVDALLRYRVSDLVRYGVSQGAVLVVDLEGNRIRAWAVADDDAGGAIGIDAVRAPRQPGSALKPFLYALALESGWNAQTTIADEPTSERVGAGLHSYRNYSRATYGRVSLREALGNSLNIPAVKTLQFVGGERFLEQLHRLGMQSLTQHPAIYGDGLALGNGELSLYELVQAYAALARGGRWRALSPLADDVAVRSQQQVIEADAAAVITDILSDAQARELEFGDGGLLRFPVQTAVKTGTSTDYRDAWTVAYNSRYVVGAWMGNLSGRATDGVTGSVGPALLVRSVFSRLNRDASAGPLAIEASGANRATNAESELDRPVHAPEIMMLQPFDGLQMAMDPRIPDDREAFEFVLGGAAPDARVRWYVDGRLESTTREPRWLWRLSPGEHEAYAEVAEAGNWIATEPAHYTVR
jgi:penicillin-binding protein 1C